MNNPKTLDTPSVEMEPGKTISKTKPKESGGPKGLEPTRFGDWERNGKCVDF